MYCEIGRECTVFQVSCACACEAPESGILFDVDAAALFECAGEMQMDTSPEIKQHALQQHFFHRNLALSV